ncbi:MAG: hypothetical protein ACRDDX_12530 [Cellulosilyticaceae bacterium]
MREEMQAEKNRQKELRCNVCGQDIKQLPHHHTEDYLFVEKEWNYFSAKDLTKHSFVVCETCYDRWIQSFAIPVEEKAVIEVFKF